YENLEHQRCNSDWLIVEDFTYAAMKNPGLITSRPDETYETNRIHEIAHQYFGNLVTLRSWEQIWLNEGFARFFEDQFKFQVLRNNGLQVASLHDPAMHNEFSYTRSQFVINHFMTYSWIHYEKAGQLIALIKRFIGGAAFDKALNDFSDISSIIRSVTAIVQRYLVDGIPEAHAILSDWVYQPGVTLLTVDQEDERVIIQQRRFLRTDFVEDLRDFKTRWTIPLYYTINGVEHVDILPHYVEKFIINVPENCNFLIDASYPHLYVVHYKNK
ncbi:hypothetical protein PENTCL1PPCAC_8100, partial [Pristionchus entomophagus]